MSLDGIAIHALADELHQQLSGGRIDKIQQPDASTILLSVRQPGRNDKLLLSSNAQTARIGITHAVKNNPVQPPLFCMVLRKHLEGSKIIEIRQVGWERIIQIVCEGYDELGEKSNPRLNRRIYGQTQQSNFSQSTDQRHLRQRPPVGCGDEPIPAGAARFTLYRAAAAK